MVVHGGDIYGKKIELDFSTNLNFLGMPESVRRAAKEGVEFSEHYPDVRCGALRRAISEREGIPWEWVICGNGASDLIFSLTLAEKPRRAVMFVPTFQEYARALAAVGCEITFCPLRETEEFRYTRRILSLLTEEVDLLVLCNPNNPTGQLISPGLLEEILETCREKGIRVLLDECFLDFVEEPERHTAAPLLSRYPGLFVLKAFTKLYAMAGLRLGYGMSGDEKLLCRMEEVRQPWSVSVSAQFAGMAALGETEYVSRYRGLLREERAYLKKELADTGMRVYGSHANYIFFRGQPGLAEELSARGILIRDCSNYPGLTEGYYRVAVRSHAENRRLMEAMRDIVTLKQRGNHHGKGNHASGNHVQCGEEPHRRGTLPDF